MTYSKQLFVIGLIACIFGFIYTDKIGGLIIGLLGSNCMIGFLILTKIEDLKK